MQDELLELVTELLEYFDISDTENYPTVAVWSGGQFTEGVVSDELYGILLAMKELRDSQVTDE